MSNRPLPFLLRPSRLLSAAVAAGLALATASAALAAAAAKPTAAELFRLTKVWDVRLTFTAAEWAAMEPTGGTNNFFGGPPAGPGGQPGTPAAAPGNGPGAAAPDGRGGGTGGAPGGGGPGGGRGMNLQGPEGGRNGLSAAMGIDFPKVEAEVEIGDVNYGAVSVRYKGNASFMQSRNDLKRSMKITFPKTGPGPGGIATLNLHTNVADISWMVEPLSHKLFADAGVPASRTSYARVYVTVPGKYQGQFLGLYSLVEDPDEVFAQDRFGAAAGAIFKPVTQNLFDYLGEDWKKYNQTYDPKTAATDAEKQRVMDFARLVTQADDAEFAAKMGSYLDLEEFARFMAATVYLSTLDSILTMGQNFLVHLDAKTHKFQFIGWDLDNSFGQFALAGTQEQREQLSIMKPWRGQNRFLERVYQVEAFRKIYLARMAEFSATIFQPERIQRQVDEVAAAIRPSVKDESEAKLVRFDKAVAGEVTPTPVMNFGRGGPPAGGPANANPGAAGPGDPGRGGDGGPGGPAARGGPGGPGGGMPAGGMSSGTPIKAFVVARAMSIADQLSGKSTGMEIPEMGFGGRGGPGPGSGPAAP